MHDHPDRVPPLRVGYILKQYPRLSETFILNEILGLEANHVNVSIFSLRHATEGRFHPGVSMVKAPFTTSPSQIRPHFSRRCARCPACRPIGCLRCSTSSIGYPPIDGLAWCCKPSSGTTGTDRRPRPLARALLDSRGAHRASRAPSDRASLFGHSPREGHLSTHRGLGSRRPDSHEGCRSRDRVRREPALSGTSARRRRRPSREDLQRPRAPGPTDSAGRQEPWSGPGGRKAGREEGLRHPPGCSRGAGSRQSNIALCPRRRRRPTSQARTASGQARNHRPGDICWPAPPERRWRTGSVRLNCSPLHVESAQTEIRTPCQRFCSRPLARACQPSRHR